MSKTAQERYEEIKREIIQISESFIMTKKDKSVEDITTEERRHFEILHLSLRELIEELRTLSVNGLKIPIIYKKLVNSLVCNLGKFTSQEYFQEVRQQIGYANLRVM